MSLSFSEYNSAEDRIVKLLEREKFAQHFKSIFNVSFYSLADVTVIDNECCDDGINHYVDKDGNIYSYDHINDEWLPINTNTDERRKKYAKHLFVTKT